MDYEYRVRWQREPRENVIWHNGPKTTSYRALYQSEKAALAKVARLVEIDEQQRDGEDPVDDFDRPIFDFPRLIGKPTIERREVGAWQAV